MSGSILGPNRSRPTTRDIWPIPQNFMVDFLSMKGADGPFVLDEVGESCELKPKLGEYFSKLFFSDD